MNALSLWQPWASAMVPLAWKQNETRSWPTRYRGDLIIHAAKKKIDTYELDGYEWYDAMFEKMPAETMPLGSLLGIVEMVDCVPTTALAKEALCPECGKSLIFDPNGSPEDWCCLKCETSFSTAYLQSHRTLNPREEALGNYEDGRFAWITRNARAFDTPIPYRGSQGFFDVPGSVFAGVKLIEVVA